MLIDFATKQLEGLSHMRDHIARLKKEENYPIRIGSSSNFAQYRLPQILTNYNQAFPEQTVSVMSGYSSEMIQLLTSNDIQVGFITGNYDWHGEKVLLSNDPLTIISKTPIEMDDLPNRTFIAYKPNSFSNKSHSPSNPISQIIMNWWLENYSEKPQIAMNLDKVETCKQMVNHNLGFSIVPISCIKSTDDLYSLPIKNEKNEYLARKTWLAYKKSSLEIATIRNFIKEIIHLAEVDNDMQQSD